MTLTTGYEITTAATNLFNAAITVVLMISIFRMKGPAARKYVWGASFGLFLIVCLLGTYAHGVQLPETVKSQTWDILYVALAFMAASLAVAVLYEIHGPECLKLTVPVFALSAIAFVILRQVFSSLVPNGFVLFLIYCGGILIFLIIKLFLARREKPHMIIGLWGIGALIAASVLQNVKAIQFHLIWDFNYNAVYHLVTLIFVILMYCFVKRADELDTANEPDRN